MLFDGDVWLSGYGLTSTTVPIVRYFPSFKPASPCYHLCYKESQPLKSTPFLCPPTPSWLSLQEVLRGWEPQKEEGRLPLAGMPLVHILGSFLPSAPLRHGSSLVLGLPAVGTRRRARARSRRCAHRVAGPPRWELAPSPQGPLADLQTSPTGSCVPLVSTCR